MRAALADFLARTASQPFAWGRCDCLLWSADAVLAATGFDPASEYRGAYADARGAVALLRARGGAAAMMGAGVRGILGRNDGAKNGVGIVLIGKRAHGAVIISGRAWVKADGAALVPRAASVCRWGV